MEGILFIIVQYAIHIYSIFACWTISIYRVDIGVDLIEKDAANRIPANTHQTIPNLS